MTNKFHRIVRRTLRANKRIRRPSWAPVEQPFEERPAEVVDINEVESGREAPR